MSGIERVHGIDEQVVIDYFRRISSGDMVGLLNLFSKDAIIDEPFSKSLVVGKSQIEIFLKTVIMANRGTQVELDFVRDNNSKNRLIVFATFRKSAVLKGKFLFEFVNKNRSKIKERIKFLKIEFVE